MNFITIVRLLPLSSTTVINSSYSVWTKYSDRLFRRSKSEKDRESGEDKHGRSVQPAVEGTFQFYSETLEKKSDRAVKSLSGYEPPPDVSNIIRQIISDTKTIALKTSQKPHPPDVDVNDLCQENTHWQDMEISDLRTRFKLLERCRVEFDGHCVPNSMLHAITCVRHLIEFYSNPISAVTKLEDLKMRGDLPPNLHIQWDPVRFHPDTDDKFGGVTAFPGRPTIIYSLRSKKKGLKPYYPPTVNPLEKDFGPIG